MACSRNVLLLLLSSFISISANKYETVHQWNYINFTWPSPEKYQTALKNGDYIPENNAMTGMRFYNNKLYISMPKLRTGTPVTLAYVSDRRVKTNPLLMPFPSWDFNVGEDCSILKNVQAMEIDANGIMWVIDGVRINNITNCPTKLVLLDLNCNGKLVHSYTFPESVSLSVGGYLNDIVVDGDFAYITDNSNISPGLIVYSRSMNESWKILDNASMVADPSAANFTINGTDLQTISNINGIALAPRTIQKMLYYCPLTTFNLYGISTEILKDKELCSGDKWRKEVKLIGRKPSQSAGLIMDNAGNLFMTLIPLYGVAKWNIKTPFNETRIIDQNFEEIVWPDSFAFDSYGYNYLMSTKIYRFSNANFPLTVSSEVIFHVMKLFTGTNSYIFG